MQTPLLTVIIPAFRAEEYLLRAVNSIQKQPRVDAVKIIIVDDGSPDKSGEVADRIAQQYGNVLVLHQINGGVSAARNSAISCVDTKYTAFLDADDFWEDGFLDDEIVSSLENENHDLYQFAYRTVSHDYQFQKRSQIENTVITYSEPQLYRYDFSYFCSFLYRTSLIHTHHLGFLPCKINEDQPFVEMCFYFAESCKKINRVIFNYWSNQSSCLHSTHYLTYYNEKYKSFKIAEAFYRQYGLSYHSDFSYVMLIDELLPGLCIDKSYREVIHFRDTEPRMEVLKQYRELGLEAIPKLKKRIFLFMEHPFLFWLRCKTIVRATGTVKAFLYRHPKLRRFPDFVFYRLRGYKKRNS